jgi:hypothetical protein
MIFRRRFAALLLGLAGMMPVWARAIGKMRLIAQSPGTPPIELAEETVLGWRVKVNVAFRRAQPAIVDAALALLEKELDAITHSVPPQRLRQLHNAVFWLDERVRDGTPAEKVPVFHPNPDWLREHGLNPAMAGGIELPNAQTFLDSYSWEPAAILHELAHFYHHTILGDGNPVIRAAYDHARDAHLYENVAHYDGKTAPTAYALVNDHEFFAELTEAYFGRNDFFPFTRTELESYDPVGFAMVKTLWELP